METVPFPWKQDLEDNKKQTLEPPAPKNKLFGALDSESKEKLKQTIKRYAGPTLFIVALLVLGLINKPGRPAASLSAHNPANQDVVVLLLMTPLAKGEEIEGPLLKEVLVDRRELTKTQILERLRAEDVGALKGRMRAKKDLPSNRPLFWKDVEIKKNTAQAPVSRSIQPQTPRRFEILSPEGKEIP